MTRHETDWIGTGQDRGTEGLARQPHAEGSPLSGLMSQQRSCEVNLTGEPASPDNGVPLPQWVGAWVTGETITR